MFTIPKMTLNNKTKSLRDNKNSVLLSGDKDTSIVIMNKMDYDKKVEEMINEGNRAREI